MEKYQSDKMGKVYLMTLLLYADQSLSFTVTLQSFPQENCNCDLPLK